MDERWVQTVLSDINGACERFANFYDIDADLCDAAMENLTAIYEALECLHLRVVWNNENAVALRRAVDIVVDEASIKGAAYMMKRLHELDMDRLRYEYEK